MMSNTVVTIVMYILVIITFHNNLLRKGPHFVQKQNGECPIRSPEGVAFLVIDLTN